MRYKAIIFDMDGTLTVPAMNFASLREDIGATDGDILLEMEKWSEERRANAWEVIERYESAVIAATKIQEGCVDFLIKLRDNGCKLAILTRNSRKSVDAFIELIGFSFDAVLTREHTHVKPSPVPVHDILRDLNVAAESAMVVGDYVHDLESGNAAGTDTCFFHNPGAASFAEFADFTVSSYTELDTLIFNTRN